MIIELVGLPGSGKTTFAKKLADMPGWTRVRVSGRCEILWYDLCFVLRHPISTMLQMKWLFRYRGRPRLWYTKFVNLFLVHNAKFMKARGRGRFIIDQSHLQNVISLFDEPVDRSVIESYVRIFPKSDHVLFFTLPEHVLEERMRVRGYGVRESESEDDRHKWLEAARLHFTMLPSVLGTCGVSLHELGPEVDNDRALSYFSASTAIYYVHPTRMPTEKAHGGQIARMMSEWGALGARVTLVAGFSDKLCAGGDVAKYYGVEKNFSIRFVSQRSLHERLKRHPKLAYFLNSLIVFWRLMWWTPEPDAIIFTRRPELAWLFSLKGYTSIYECHEWFAHSWRLPYFFASHANMVVTINRYTGEEFIKRGFLKKKLTTETNGVLYEAFALPASKADARKALGLSLDHNILLYAGGLKMMGEEKGVMTMLLAVKELNDPKTLFVAVGGKPEDIKEYEGKTEELGIRERCIFIGRQTREQLALYQRSADALLVTHPRTHLFEYYMAPLKVFEYMASGRAIIASDLLSLREVLDDNSAFWAKPDDVEDLAQVMKEVVSNENEAVRRGRVAQELAKQHTWRARAERLMARFDVLRNSVDTQI